MSAVGLRLTVILCVSCTVLSDPGGSGVVWKKAGEAVVIQCSTSKDEEYMILHKGLHEEVQVIHTEFKPEGNVIAAAFSARLQVKTKGRDVDITINNLTSEDTGPYWCVYKTFDLKTGKRNETKGKGSVLLVVTANGNQVNPVCERNYDNLVLVFVVIAAAVLISVIMGAFMWMFFKGLPQRLNVFHLPLSSASSTLTPTTFMSSLTASINLLFGLPLCLLPDQVFARNSETETCHHQ